MLLRGCRTKATFDEAYRFSMIYPPGSQFYPIMGALVRAAPNEPYVLHKRVGGPLDNTVERYEPVGVFDEPPPSRAVAKLLGPVPGDARSG